MTKKTLPYREGDWVTVPLRTGGYAVGIIARLDGRGSVLGYFFGPNRESAPSLEDTTAYEANDALFVTRFGDLALIEREWKVLGRREDWDRQNWPMPVFGRYQELNDQAYRVVFDDDDPSKVLYEEKITEEECIKLPSDSFSGSGAVEKWLTYLLNRDAEDVKTP